MKRVYIISGPAGVGKSTISKQLAKQFDDSAYIEGDLINHMVVGGYFPPWESKELLSLTWENIADLSVNFIQSNKNVVIDYVALPEEVKRFSQKIYNRNKNIEIVYVVLWVEGNELLKRDALRIKEHQMGMRCLELVEEFKSKRIDKHFIYDTTELEISDIDEIVMNIIENPGFKY